MSQYCIQCSKAHHLTLEGQSVVTKVHGHKHTEIVPFSVHKIPFVGSARGTWGVGQKGAQSIAGDSSAIKTIDAAASVGGKTYDVGVKMRFSQDDPGYMDYLIISVPGLDGSTKQNPAVFYCQHAQWQKPKKK